MGRRFEDDERQINRWKKIVSRFSVKLVKKYIKAKAREFGVVIKMNFLTDEAPKENNHYTCIDCIAIDFVMRMGKKKYSQVYLEKCKYGMKKTKMIKFLEAELKN